MEFKISDKNQHFSPITAGLTDKFGVGYKLQKLVWRAAKEFDKNLKIEDVHIEHPASSEHGDYATNIGLILAKSLKAKPFDLASKIAAELTVCRPDFIEKVEAVPPGFVNIWLSKEFLIDLVVQSIKLGEKFGSSKTGEGKTVVIDYSSPNIAKPFGIGHLRSTIIGQALYNIYKFTGWKTIGDNHLGDWGTQFGKLIVAIKKWGREDPAEMSIKDLEELYVKFHKAAEKEPELEDEARAWFKKLEAKDSEAKEIWQSSVSLSLKEFDRIYDLLGVKIDYALGESFYEDKMDKMVIEAKNKGITKESRGALIIEIPKIKTPLMLLKSDGATTYHARDLATIKYRLGKWRPDLYIYEVGAEQKLYFQQLFAAAVILGYAELNQFVHIGHGLYRWSGGKFSTREGKTIYLEEVLQEAIQRARELAQGAGISKELPENLQEKIARAVGIGAVKYNDLKQSPEGDIVFDWDKILSLEGNSGPYLQYTYARARSVLRKSGVHLRGVHSATSEVVAQSTSCEVNAEELAILRTIYQFPEVVLESAKNFAPNSICNFLFDLAQKYNNFYNLHPIIKAPSEELINLRLALTLATTQVLKNGLLLLGIEPLERM